MDISSINAQPKINKKYTSTNKTYYNIICDAINSTSNKKMVVSDIYRYVQAHYPSFDEQSKAKWQNSIRHALSFKKIFVKCKEEKDAKSRGNYWSLIENYEQVLSSRRRNTPRNHSIRMLQSKKKTEQFEQVINFYENYLKSNNFI